MCMPPEGVEPAPYFALLAKLARRHGVAGLSMGMSADYETRGDDRRHPCPRRHRLVRPRGEGGESWTERGNEPHRSACFIALRRRRRPRRAMEAHSPRPGWSQCPALRRRTLRSGDLGRHPLQGVGQCSETCACAAPTCGKTSWHKVHQAASCSRRTRRAGLAARPRSILSVDRLAALHPGDGDGASSASASS